MNYFDVLKLSVAEIQGQDETAIAEKVNKAHSALYRQTIGAYANVPRRDGFSQQEWQKILNDAKATLLDPAKREAHLAEISGRAKEETTEAPPPPPPPPLREIAFDGTYYATPAELGMALARDWSKAASFWERRSEYVFTWVFDVLGLQSLGDALAALDDDDIPFEIQVFNSVYLLAPNASPMRFRDMELSREGLVAVGERAANQANVRETLLTLYRQRILTLAGSLSGREVLTEVSRRWDEAVINYERLRSEFSTQDVAVPELDDDVLVVLLAGSVPTPAVLAALRADAHRISTEDALACPWFRELGTPEDMSVAALAMLPHLQAPAEHRGRDFRTRPFRGCVGGIIVGSLFGKLVQWAHEQGESLGTDGFDNFFATLTGIILLVGVIVAFYLAVTWYIEGTAGLPRAWRSRVRRRSNRRGTRQ